MCKGEVYEKEGIWSRVSLLLIMILFMNSIGGCGKSKKLETGNAADYSTFVYIPEYITLPTGDDIYISDFNTFGNKLYFTVNESGRRECKAADLLGFL